MDDNGIIQLYLRRAESAIPETAAKYGRYCRYIAFSILKSNEDSEECVNDTYFRAWNCIPPQIPNCLKTFLGRITRNLALNRYEQLTAEKRGCGRIPLVLEELAECIPSYATAEQSAEADEVRNVLNKFLAELPVGTRKLFVRRYWYMSSIREIAKDFGMSESSVTVTLFRTREKLKKTLEKEGIVI
ncbi:MAG: sigma-70 family RNA polymerase sigma factor [Oscillospiraceae bacterium]|nr:sigma-70 family RNA polymerase sigma factor [Oscillospiraceae bacterium]